MTIKLSQTLANNWVITLPNPEEAGWETQLAEFDFDSAPSGKAREVLMKAAAAAAVTLATELGRELQVTSHRPDDRAEMEAYAANIQDAIVTNAMRWQDNRK